MVRRLMSAWGLMSAGVLLACGTSAQEPAAPPPPVVVEAAPCEGAKPEDPKSVWAKVPPARPTPRAGLFFIPPQGPGYYSLLDALDGTYRDKRPAQPYSAVSLMQGPFFDADFRYLDKPDNQQTHWTDPLKRVHLGDDFLCTAGGEFRSRYMNEVNSRLSGRDNAYDLVRTRVFGDLWYRDAFRVYAEFQYADSLNHDLPPLGIDVNRGDVLNLFVEVKAMEVMDKPVYVRGGRQELLLGSQRLISPPDWANTLRTYDGVRAYRVDEKFDVDLFWLRPVPPKAEQFDTADNEQSFAGAWFTYRPAKGQLVDFYYLNLDNQRPVARGRGNVPGDFNVSTFGLRYAGDKNNVLWDFEGMVQFGDWSNQDISAGAATASVGYNFAKAAMTPQIWVAYDYASGDHNPGTTGTHGTFNQLFPFGHYYFGYLDLVGRQNIHDVNLQLAFWPAKWVTVITQYHHFRLDSAKDALYSAGGAVLRRDPTGRAGGDVGDEIDFAANFHLTQNQDLFVGYSKLFAGDFLKRTGSGRSPELFCLQYSLRY